MVRQAFDHRWMSLSLLLLAFVGLVTVVVSSPGFFVYEEPFSTADYLTVFHDHGLSRDFLTSLPGTYGPLNTFVQLAFEPLTSLSPVRMRLENVLLLVVVGVILYFASARDDVAGRLFTAGSVLVVPTTWVLAGMALSEMPALVFAALSLFLLCRGLQALGDKRSVLLWFLASAVSLGVAAWGRQPYILLAGVPPVLALMDVRLRTAAALYMCVVLAMVLPLFVIWGGLTPPDFQLVRHAPSLYNSFLLLGYAGFALALLAPALLWRHRRFLLVLFAVIALMNAVLDIWSEYPLRTAAERLLPSSVFYVYGGLCAALVLTSGIAVLAFVGHSIWQAGSDTRLVAANLSLLFMCIWPSFMDANFSSRYMEMGLPYLVLAVEPLRQRWDSFMLTATLAGSATGAISLLGYFS